MYSICEWAPCSWAKNEQILKISRFLLLWQLGCNFCFRTFFTYRLRQVIRNMKRSNFSHIKHPLKRPPSGRKVSATVKSASPRMILSAFSRFLTGINLISGNSTILRARARRYWIFCNSKSVEPAWSQVWICPVLAWSQIRTDLKRFKALERFQPLLGWV